MSIMDLVPPRNTDANFSRINHQLHAEIDEQTSHFIACGGLITEVPRGVCAVSETRPPLRNEYTGEYSIKEFDSRQNKQQKAVLATKYQSPYGENIYQYENSKYFYVKLGGRYYGARMRLTTDAARELRDKLRDEFGMPPAAY
jgi:hypothetical protein